MVWRHLGRINAHLPERDRMLGMMSIGPLVNVRLGPHPEDIARLTAEGEAVPEPEPVKLMMDTGAERTVVEEVVARHLNLVPVRFTRLLSATQHIAEAPVYLMSVYLDMQHESGETATVQ